MERNKKPWESMSRDEKDAYKASDAGQRWAQAKADSSKNPLSPHYSESAQGRDNKAALGAQNKTSFVNKGAGEAYTGLSNRAGQYSDMGSLSDKQLQDIERYGANAATAEQRAAIKAAAMSEYAKRKPNAGQQVGPVSSAGVGGVSGSAPAENTPSVPVMANVPNWSPPADRANLPVNVTIPAAPGEEGLLSAVMRDATANTPLLGGSGIQDWSAVSPRQLNFWIAMGHPKYAEAAAKEKQRRESSY